MLWDKKERKKERIPSLLLHPLCSFHIVLLFDSKKKKSDSMIISVTGLRLLIFERKRKKVDKSVKGEEKIVPRT